MQMRQGGKDWLNLQKNISKTGTCSGLWKDFQGWAGCVSNVRHRLCFYDQCEQRERQSCLPEFQQSLENLRCGISRDQPNFPLNLHRIVADLHPWRFAPQGIAKFCPLRFCPALRVLFWQTFGFQLSKPSSALTSSVVYVRDRPARRSANRCSAM